MIFNENIKKRSILKVILFVLFIVVSCPNMGYSKSINENKVIDKIELSYFADSKELSIKDRKNLVSFFKEHKNNNSYEIEIHSLSDPLKLGLDIDRIIEIKGLFREHGIELNKLVNAKVRFISDENQRIIVIRKVNKKNGK